MATRIYGIDRGSNYSTITEAVGSATTKGVELTVDLAKLPYKKDVIIALQELIAYITRDGYLPA